MRFSDAEIRSYNKQKGVPRLSRKKQPNSPPIPNRPDVDELVRSDLAQMLLHCRFPPEQLNDSDPRDGLLGHPHALVRQRVRLSPKLHQMPHQYRLQWQQKQQQGHSNKRRGSKLSDKETHGDKDGNRSRPQGMELPGRSIETGGVDRHEVHSFTGRKFRLQSTKNV